MLLDPTLLGIKFFGQGLFWIKNFLNLIIFLTKTTKITTIATKTSMGFDTIEINLVIFSSHNGTGVWYRELSG